jgi:hypothetical protein
MLSSRHDVALGRRQRPRQNAKRHEIHRHRTIHIAPRRLHRALWQSAYQDFVSHYDADASAAAKLLAVGRISDGSKPSRA